MTAYIVRRVGQAIAVVIGVMILTFVMVHLEPGSAARATLGVRATPTSIAIFNRTYGLNHSITVQFVDYVKQVTHGNFGVSFSMQQPVSTLIVQRLPRDAVLLGISTVLALLIALPLGMYQAVRRHGVGDNVVTVVAFILYAMPDFFFALLLIDIFAVQTHLLPYGAPPSTSVAGLLSHPSALVLPVLTMTLVSVAGYSRYMRSSAIDVLVQDFIRVARAKGLSQRMVMSRHVLRNAMLPIITILGLSAPTIVAGAVIAEQVFNYPGMGLLFYQAATSHDFPILLGSTLVVGVATVIGNLIADIAYGVLDPRVRYGND
jgi:peptide/nickel transport system permease protein